MHKDIKHATSDTARTRRRARRFGFLACSAVLIAGLGGYAYGTIPNGATGVISACYVKSGAAVGTLRVIDAQAGATCKATETPITWNSKGINDRGAWSSTTAYAKGDAVLYAGQTYLAKAASKAVVPTNTTSWQLLAAKGATGATGPVRPAGPAGSGHGYHFMVPGVGPNDVPAAPSFVAPADEKCLVTATVLFGPQIGEGVVLLGEIRVAIGINGGPFADDGDGIPLYNTGFPAEPPPTTVSWVFAVGAGQTIQFAAWFNPFDPNAQYGELDAYLSYMCS